MKTRFSLFFSISLAICALDQFTKYLIKGHFHVFDVIAVLPFLNIVYVENTGSAFGMLRGLGNVFFIVIAAFAIAVVAFLIVRDGDNRLGFSLILGGAAGNLADRVTYGYVIDFLDLYAGKYHWPAFNVADSALTVGVALLLTKSILNGRRT